MMVAMKDSAALADLDLDVKTAASHAAPAAHAPAPAALPDLRYADPTALGLFGLAIACAALLPIAFGMKSAMTVDALRTASWLCLLFGGGCQFLAGLMSFANKNMLGGTLLTTFSFNWVMNWWALDGAAQGKAASSTITLAVDLCFILIFFAMTYAFAFYAKVLVLFLVDIDLIYGFRIARELFHVQSLGLPIALATVVLMLVALYIAIALVLVNASGKSVLPLGGPVLKGTGAAH
jgi:succinate-acetate transporter protein